MLGFDVLKEVEGHTIKIYDNAFRHIAEIDNSKFKVYDRPEGNYPTRDMQTGEMKDEWCEKAFIFATYPEGGGDFGTTWGQVLEYDHRTDEGTTIKLTAHDDTLNWFLKFLDDPTGGN